jgi:general secretion pathway protein F
MSLLEPIIILVMGLVVGFIVIAIMLPILQMSSGVR